MEFHLLILLLSFAKAARGLKEQATHDGSNDGGAVEQDSLPWINLEELAELEKNAEYTIKVIILTMNRCACQHQSLPS